MDFMEGLLGRLLIDNENPADSLIGNGGANCCLRYIRQRGNSKKIADGAVVMMSAVYSMIMQ